MLGDKQRDEIAANTDLQPYYAWTKIRLNGGLLDKNDISRADEEYILNLEVTISYKPRRDMPKYEQMGDYIVKPRNCRRGQRTRYRGWEDYCEKAEEDVIQKLIKKWTDISKGYFDLAKANSGATIPIGCDYVRYNEHLKELYRETYGKEPPPDARLLSVEAEAKGSELANQEYHQRLYNESKERMLARSKSNKKK